MPSVWGEVAAIVTSERTVRTSQNRTAETGSLSVYFFVQFSFWSLCVVFGYTYNSPLHAHDSIRKNGPDAQLFGLRTDSYDVRRISSDIHEHSAQVTSTNKAP